MQCDFVLVSASAVAEFALWIAPRLWGAHLDLQDTDRFKTQPIPLWVRHVPGIKGDGIGVASAHASGAKAVAGGGRRRALAQVFCAALAAACANETQRLYGGRYCSKCAAPKAPAPA